MTDSERLKTSFEIACDRIADYLEHGVSEEDKDHARLAVQVIGSYTRIRAVEAHEKSLSFQVARSMANNTEELKAMVQRTLPEYAVPALPAATV